jgi:GNAT superfamily N-acetyltransferase
MVAAESLGSEAGSSVGSEETVARLRDGTPVVVRSIRLADRAGIEAFVHRLSESTIESRYAVPLREGAVLDELVGPLTGPDRCVVVLETLHGATRILGSAEYVRFASDPTRAEVAFLVEDDTQGRGAGTLLLQELVRRARRVGIRTLTAVVMEENSGMREVITHSWYPYRRVTAASATTFTLDITAAGLA